MLRALCLALTLVTLPLAGASADAPPKLGANAALQYWQAFAALPRLADDEQRNLLADCLTMPLDAHARQLAAKAEYAFRRLHDGAALPQCDWGLPSEKEGVGILLFHNDGARVLCALTCLRARVLFEDGQSAAAVADIIAGMTLARHASRDSLLVMVLAGYAMEHRLGEALGAYLPRLDAKAIGDLQSRLATLPAGGTPAAGMLNEERFYVGWFVRQIKEADDKESLLSILVRLFESPQKGRAFLDECGGTADGILHFVDETRQAYARVAQKLDLPLDAFAKELEREERKQAGNPVFKLFFPAIAKVRWAQARADVRAALLRAALAIQAHGRDAVKDHPDPVAGGPFEYTALPGGFELRSRLKADEELRIKWKLDERTLTPLRLTVGMRGK
jgi:hypothetical protein